MPVKPTTREEAYFAEQEAERKRKLADGLAERNRLEEEAKHRELHWMRCPKCGSELSEVTYRDQRVDRCEACGGVWLDAGELEALALKEGGFLWGFRKAIGG